MAGLTVRKVLAGLGVVAAVAASALLGSAFHVERGYFSPQFTPDGAAVVFVRRDVRGFVFGFGYETFTPPARVWVQRDRFSLVRITLADGRTERLQSFPPSPLEGGWISAYRPGLMGSATAHLRWADATHLEYELAVTRHRQPMSETFVVRRRWSPESRQWIENASWDAGSTGMGGDERSQLHGTREVVAIRARTSMPCAVLLVTTGTPEAKALEDTRACRAACPDGYMVASLAEQLRGPAIERAELLERTHDALVREGRERGLSDGDARLAAIRGMQQRGLYPKPTVLVALPAEAANAGLPVFAISDEELAVGLFPDIQGAIERPGEEVEKSIGAYIVHRDYDTSRRINQYLDAGRDAEFYVQARGRLWRIRVDRP